VLDRGSIAGSGGYARDDAGRAPTRGANVLRRMVSTSTTFPRISDFVHNISSFVLAVILLRSAEPVCFPAFCLWVFPFYPSVVTSRTQFTHQALKSKFNVGDAITSSR